MDLCINVSVSSRPLVYVWIVGREESKDDVESWALAQQPLSPSWCRLHRDFLLAFRNHPCPIPPVCSLIIPFLPHQCPQWPQQQDAFSAHTLP